MNGVIALRIRVGLRSLWNFADVQSLSSAGRIAQSRAKALDSAFDFFDFDDSGFLDEEEFFKIGQVQEITSGMSCRTLRCPETSPPTMPPGI